MTLATLLLRRAPQARYYSVAPTTLLTRVSLSLIYRPSSFQQETRAPIKTFHTTPQALGGFADLDPPDSKYTLVTWMIEPDKSLKDQQRRRVQKHVFQSISQWYADTGQIESYPLDFGSVAQAMRCNIDPLKYRVFRTTDMKDGVHGSLVGCQNVCTVRARGGVTATLEVMQGLVLFDTPYENVSLLREFASLPGVRNAGPAAFVLELMDELCGPESAGANNNRTRKSVLRDIVMTKGEPWRSLSPCEQAKRLDEAEGRRGSARRAHGWCPGWEHGTLFRQERMRLSDRRGMRAPERGLLAELSFKPLRDRDCGGFIAPSLDIRERVV